MFGVLIKVEETMVCQHIPCDQCKQHCLKRVLYVLRKAHIQPFKVDETHSTVLRYTNPIEAWQALAVVSVAGKVKAKIIYPI